MTLEIQAIQSTDFDSILNFENQRLIESIPNQEERIFASWSARWRPESLESYIKTGWSYLARNSDHEIVGYFLAQPLLFFQGHAQSLWVEHLSSSKLQARDELAEFAYKLAREKHFQRVYFPNFLLNSVKPMNSEVWAPDVLTIKTTKG